MKLHHVTRQTVNHTLLVLCHIKHSTWYAADVVTGTHQVAPSSVKTAAFGLDRKEMGVITPFAEHVGLRIPFATCTTTSHGNQFSV